jgi:hypothetical protein
LPDSNGITRVPLNCPLFVSGPAYATVTPMQQ